MRLSLGARSVRVRHGPVRLLAALEKGFVVLALLLFTGAVIPLLRQPNLPGLQDAQEAEGDPFTQILFLCVYLVAFLLVVARWRRFAYVVTRDKLLLLLVGIALFSILWSAAPEVTLRRSLALVGTTLFGVYLATRYTLGEQVRLVAWALGVAALLSLLIALKLPHYGISGDNVNAGAWRGVFVHKNVLGRLMALGAMVFLLLAFSGGHRLLACVGLGLAIGLLLLSNSATALVIFLTLLVLFPLYRTLRWRSGLVVPFFMLTVIVSGGVTMVLLGNVEGVLSVLGRDNTLTGRTDLWSAVFEMIRQRPWLGYGYNGFWLGWEGKSAYVWLVTSWTPPHAHNGFLDLWLDLGLLGVAVFVLGLLTSLSRTVAWVRTSRAPEGLWPLLYLTFVLLANLTESTILTRNSIFWVLYVAVLLSIYVRRSRDGAISDKHADPRKRISISNSHLPITSSKKVNFE